jgi:RNA-splicing ligase RtcB
MSKNVNFVKIFPNLFEKDIVLYIIRLGEHMFELIGKNTTAKIYAKEIDDKLTSQIYGVLNGPVFNKDSNVAIMEDCHFGSGICIGFVAKLGDRIDPRFCGVDISCGVTAYPLDVRKLNLQELDKFIQKNIPMGMTIHQKVDNAQIESTYNKFLNGYDDFIKTAEDISKKINCSRTIGSIGTLGGGNHFIEIDQDSEGKYFIIIHSGSRNFGLKIAEFYQQISDGLTIDKTEFKKKVAEIKAKFSGPDIPVEIQKLKDVVTVKGYLDGQDAQNYYHDSEIANRYAKLSRRYMIRTVLEYLGLKYKEDNIIESVHNYIDFSEKTPIIRKGAIRAYTGEKCLIPLNMRDGILLCEGLSNPDRNCSGPHGAGRLYSRSKAKETLSMQDFKDAMVGIYTTCVSSNTIDESPMAYKNASDIIDTVQDTVKIIDHWKPILSIKSGSED